MFSCGTKFNDRKWFAFDICGLGCVTLSYSSHAYALYIVHRYLTSESSAALIIFYTLYLPFSMMAIASLIRAQHTDPGAVPLGARPVLEEHEEEGGSDISSLINKDNMNISKTKKLQRGIRRCPKCNNNFKPIRAHHDSVTGRCIVKFGKSLFSFFSFSFME